MRLIDADELETRIKKLKSQIASRAAGFVDEDSYECGAVDALYDALTYLHEVETVYAVPIEPLSEWLAGYAVPPKYAREAAEAGLSPEGLTRAWKYAIGNMMECGLMEEGKHDHG